MNTSNNNTSKGNPSIIVPDTYSNRGAQTPAYPAPSMPQTAPVKPSRNKGNKY